jgi:hypothetical protein
MFSLYALAGIVPVIVTIIWLQNHLPADRRARARAQAAIGTGVLAVVLGVGFACDNPEDAIANSGPAQVWKGDPVNMVYLGLAPVPSIVCLDQITNEGWAKEIPQGLVAVTFRMGLRDYKGLVREAEWHLSNPRGSERLADHGVSLPVAQTGERHPFVFVRPMTKVEENAPEKFSFESAPPTDEENGP